MATNNYDRMHRGEAPAAAAIPNRATQKKRAARRKASRGWTVFGIIVGVIVLMSLVGVVGTTLQSLFLGIFGWAGILYSLTAIALCVLSVTGVLHRRRKWTKAHRTLLVGLSCLAAMLVLLLHLAVDKAYNATLQADGYINYGHYLSACFNDGRHTVGGVFVGWLAYPFLNVIGQKVSCIVLTVLCSGLVFSMIWPFWVVTQSRVVGQPTEERPADAAPGTEAQQPRLFVETVDGARPQRPRRRGKREVFDFAYPNKEMEEEEPEAIDQIDENDPTYKRLMREETDPEKRRLMAKELLLEMTDEEARRYLGTPEYDPAEDINSPLHYGRRDSTVARFGDPKPAPTPAREPASDAPAPADRDTTPPAMPEFRPYGGTRADAFDILFGEEPSPRADREPAPRADRAPDRGRGGYAGTVDSRSRPTAPTDAAPTASRTPGTYDAPNPPARPMGEHTAPPASTPASTPAPEPTPRRTASTDPTYVINPRRSLDDLPRRARPTPPAPPAADTSAMGATHPAAPADAAREPSRPEGRTPDGGYGADPAPRPAAPTGRDEGRVPYRPAGRDTARPRPAEPTAPYAGLRAADGAPTQPDMRRAPSAPSPRPTPYEGSHTTGSASGGRNMSFMGGAPLTPADVDGRTPDSYDTFADESPLDRALQQMDAEPARAASYADEDYADYEEDTDMNTEDYNDDNTEDYDGSAEPDPAASRVGYVDREEQEFPSAFDGFVARPAPEPEPEPEEEPEPEPDVRPRTLAVPDEKTERQARTCQPKPAPPKKVRPYTAPSLYLLRDFPPPVDMEDYEAMYHNIEDAFASYGMQVRVLGHTRGPTYTQYAVQLADGLTFKRVVGYEQDIVRKMRLNEEINIVPKVPNMDAIGVEVVNRTRSTVGLKPLLTSGVFRQDKKLYFALGVDVMGHPYYCDILSGPHMLIAGSSGSGKSVCLNTLICCLLFNYKPDYVKFILIDPKGGVEMDVYNDLPHNLLGQSATTPAATLKALDWAIEEMERRYGLMRTVNIRSLGEYNDKMLQMGMPRLPYILVIIDELADLMKLNKKMANDMETRISRLTAKARACGIHVIVATQRPSVDVITGTIKNNIPTRVAFRTATQIDSKTILERGCAEKLYGKGDLFFMANGANELKRLQCPFLSDDEVFAICEDIRAHNESVVDAAVAARIFREEATDDAQMEEDFGARDTKPTEDNPNGDPMFERVVRYVAATGTASISRIQREFRMGFARAGYLVDEMERRGFVGPADPNGSNRPRTVLITPADCDDIFGHGGDYDD